MRYFYYAGVYNSKQQHHKDEFCESISEHNVPDVLKLMLHFYCLCLSQREMGMRIGAQRGQKKQGLYFIASNVSIKKYRDTLSSMNEQYGTFRSVIVKV